MDVNREPDLPAAIATAFRNRSRLSLTAADQTRFEARLLGRLRARRHLRPAWAAALAAGAASLLIGLWLLGRPRPPEDLGPLLTHLEIAEHLDLFEHLEVIDSLDRLRADGGS